jgi:hypothetical protein
MIRLIFLCLFISFKSTSQSFEWSSQTTFPASAKPSKVIHDSKDNPIICGEYSNNSSNPIHGCFLIRYNSSGGLTWKLIFDKKKYPMVTFEPVTDKILFCFASFDPGLSGGYYLKRFDLSGTEISSFQILPSVNDLVANKIHQITADGSGGYYVIGTYMKNFKLGTFSFNDPPAGQDRFFAARFNIKDSCLWAISSNDGSVMYFANSTTDNDTNLIISATPIGNLTIQNYSINAQPGNPEPIILKITPNGLVNWITKFKSSSASFKEIQSICTDGAGNIYAIGDFLKEIELSCTSLTVTTNYNTDIFITKLGKDGICKWLKAIAGRKSEMPAGIALNDTKNNLFVSGNFSEYCSMDNLTISSAKSSTSNGVPESFIALYDVDGNAKWAINLGVDTCGSVTSNGLSCTKGSEVYMAGQFNCKVLFGNHPLFTTGNDFFVSKLSYILSSLANNYDGFSFQLFPNPSSGDVTIYSQNTYGMTHLTIYDLIGNAIYEIEYDTKTKHQFTLDLSFLSKGIYLFHFTDRQSSVIYKQIVE